MALWPDLMGAGLGSGAAALLGDAANVLVRCVGVEREGAPFLAPGYNTVATAPDQSACVIPGDIAVGKRLVLFVCGPIAGRVFAPEDCMVNDCFPGVPVDCPPGKPVIIERMNSLRFIALVGN